MEKVSLKWLKAGVTTNEVAEKIAAKAGERPEQVPDGDIYQRALVLEEEHFDATMFLNYGVLGFQGSTIEASLGTNLYKENMALGESARQWLYQLMLTLGVDFSKAWSARLLDATKRVMIVDDNGYHYATVGDAEITKEMSPETVWRCRRFPDFWSTRWQSYSFWERDSQPQADAIMTNLPGQTLCVYAADCVIGLISDPKTHAVGIFHAQWRNLVDNGTNNHGSNSRSIVEELVMKMKAAYGCEVGDMEVQLYPCASKETYEIDGKVADRFLVSGLVEAITEREAIESGERDGKYHLDLNRATTIILERMGVKKLNIRLVPFTTDDPEFPSKRNASKGRPGQRPEITTHKVVELNENAMVPGREMPLWDNNAQNVLIVMTK